MIFNEVDFAEKKYKNSTFGKHSIYFDFDVSDYCDHQIKKCTFPFYETLLKFMNENPTKKIYMTTKQLSENFEKIGNETYLINFQEFQRFCKKLDKRVDRANAFFRQEVSLENIALSSEKRGNFFASATETEIIERINAFTAEQKKNLLEQLICIDDIELPKKELENYSDEEFLALFPEILKDSNKKKIVLSNYSQIQISTLEEYVKLLKNNLGKNETFIQNWIDCKIDNFNKEISLTDKDKKKLKKSRCLIFGLEFIAHKREGNISLKRFDLLTKLSEGRSEYALIELKSPNAEVFKITEKVNVNEGKSFEYKLSDDLARAIPQILRYRDNLESKPPEDEDWNRIGLKKERIGKCIILIGTKKQDDSLWENHFSSLRRSFSNSLEIWTYSDLIQKLETTITNLKNNL